MTVNKRNKKCERKNTEMVKNKSYYEMRLAKLAANGETMNMRLINKIKRKLRKLA